MHKSLEQLIRICHEQEIPLVCIQRLFENQKQASYEPDWYANVVLFDTIVLKRIGVYQNENGKLYIKFVPDLSLMKIGGSPIESVLIPKELKDEVIQVIESAIVARFATEQVEHLVVSDAPYLSE